MYALVDCNNFYVSCERVFQPWLNNHPVLVLSNNDGCAIARSQEVKNMGIKMGEPAFKIRDLIEKNNIHVFSSNYALYADMSHRVMSLLSTYSPEIEIYSIDEAFLSFTNLHSDLVDYSLKIKNDILQNTGMPVCIGIGKTKTLAKVANHFAKKFKNNPDAIPKYLKDSVNYEEGVLMININTEIESIDKTLSLDEKPSKSRNKQHSSHKDQRTQMHHPYNDQDNKLPTLDFWLKNLDVGDIWGVGRKYKILLNKNGIMSAWDFVNTSDQWIKKHMSIVGIRTKRELIGSPCIPLETTPPAKKAIATTRSFGLMISSYSDLSEAVSTFASKCAFKLRKQKSCCSLISIFIITNRHRKDLKQYYNSISVRCDVPTNSTIEISQKALHGLKLIFKENYLYKKAGVIVSDIVSQSVIQSSLFDHVNRNKHKALMKSMDYSNFKTGREKIKLATQGSGRKWKLKNEKVSKCYTTRWDELISIK